MRSGDNTAKKTTPAAQTNDTQTDKPKRTKQKAPYIIEVLTTLKEPSTMFWYTDLDAGPFKDTGEAKRHLVANMVTGADHPELPSVRIVAIKWKGSPKIMKIAQFSL